jgi:hypothetical protein
MKITIQKSITFTVDTGKERKRIKLCFKNRPQTMKKLLKLMDLVEAEKWEAAEAELEGKWWSGRDAKLECPRLEFVGMLESGIDSFGWDTYANLVWRMVRHPDEYTVLEKK